MSDEVNTPASDKKVFDVAKPSTTPADANSKHIIVNHGPMMHDNTLVKEDNGSDLETTAPAEQPGQMSASSHGLEIKPTEGFQPDRPADQPPEPVEPPKPEQVEASAAVPGTAASSTDDTKPAETKTVRSDDKQKADEAEAAKAAQAAAEKAALISGLVDSGKYFLPINKVEERKSQRFVIAGIIIAIILAIVWLDVALDAGLISNTYHLPHTSFFAQKF